MPINAPRLWRSLEEMARIGATPGGGVNRLALSEEDRRARDLFAAWAGEAGLALTVDAMGNMFARREGTAPGAAPVLAGSHLDSVPSGGRFDGALGVLAALEAVRSLNEAGAATRRPIEVVNWTDEEGPRFPPSMLGSGVFAGAYELDWAWDRTDAAGRRFGEELARIGYRGEAPCRPRPLGGYLELHIEQGPRLAEAGAEIGVVEGIVGLTWLRATLRGERDHAGPTPMRGRRDALVGAARAIAAIREIPARLDPDFVATVGEIRAEPGAINVIPGRVVFSVDFRHRDAGLMQRARAMVEEAVREAAEGEGLEWAIEEVGASSPLAFDPAATAAVEDACAGAGFSRLRMWSAAGHDARYAAEVGPAAMIFVPCEGGKSHTEEENIRPEDAARGGEVLARALAALANEV